MVLAAEDIGGEDDWRKEMREVKREMQKFKYIKEKEDYWKLPKEFERDGGGDCEDFAIYEYWLLLKRGVSGRDMAIGIDTRHAVLRVHRMMMDDSEIYPIYWLSTGGVVKAGGMSYDE